MRAAGRKAKSERWPHLREAFNLRAEQAQAVIPVLFLLLGIGVVNVLPQTISRPFFESSTERKEIAARYGETLEDGILYVLTTEPCHDCTVLIQQLQRENIPFQTVSGTSSPLGMALYKKSIKVWGERNFPQVLLDLNGVEPNMPAIRKVLGQSNPAGRVNS